MLVAVLVLMILLVLAVPLSYRAGKRASASFGEEERATVESILGPVARIVPMPPEISDALTGGLVSLEEPAEETPEVPDVPEEAPVPPQVAQTAHQAPRALSKAVEASHEAPVVPRTTPEESRPRFTRPASQQPRERPKGAPQPKNSTPEADLTWKKWNQN